MESLSAVGYDLNNDVSSGFSLIFGVKISLKKMLNVNDRYIIFQLICELILGLWCVSLKRNYMKNGRDSCFLSAAIENFHIN